MSSPIKSSGEAAMNEAYEAALENLSKGALPTSPPQVAAEQQVLSPKASPPIPNSGSPDKAISPTNAHLMNNSAPVPRVEVGAVPALQPVEPATQMPSNSDPQPTTFPMSNEYDSVLDPTLMDVTAPHPEPVLPQQAIPRAMLPFMHQLDVSVQRSYNSAPTSVTSESPDSPNGIGINHYHLQGQRQGRQAENDPFAFYANDDNKGSMDDLSRPTSMTNLSVYGATKGTVTSASSESGVGEEFEEGGVPAPKSKKSHARKQPVGHIKRARNAFILFRKHITDSGLIPPSVETKHQNISVVAAKMWREAPQEVRHKFQEEARLEKEEHQRKYPGYRYQPVFRRTDIIRRRVRKDKAEEEKVEAVAEAMIQGKAGRALAEEVKEQISKSAAASESESEVAPKRRRRREDGELSKGALRAQRAQNRAKAMRQNLLGSSLLGGMLYNQGYQQSGPPHPSARVAGPGMAQHPGAQYHLSQHPHAHPHAPEYGMPVGYDVDGRPILRAYTGGSGGYEHPHPGHQEYQEYPAEMYRLPPIQDAVGPGMWDSHDQGGQGHYPPPRMDHWLDQAQGQAQSQGQGHYPTDQQHQDLTPEEHMHQQQGSYFEGGHQYYPEYEGEYRFPTLHDGSAAPRTAMPPPEMMMHHDGIGGGPSEWRDGPGSHILEAPSGHVVFNERLFDGVLGSAALPGGGGRREHDEGLGAFDEAVAQANDSPGW